MATRPESDNGGGTPMSARSMQDFVPLSRDDLERYRDQARELDHQARMFIRENPVAVVVGAVALGFVVGRLMSR